MIRRALVMVVMLSACGGRPDPNCNPYACYDKVRSIAVTQPQMPGETAAMCRDAYFVDLAAKTWKRTLCAFDFQQERDGTLDAAQTAVIRTQFLAIHEGRTYCDDKVHTQLLRITLLDGTTIDGYSQSCHHERVIEFDALLEAMFKLAPV